MAGRAITLDQLENAPLGGLVKIVDTLMPMIRRLIVSVALFAAVWSIAAAQAPGVHPISGRRFAEVMDASGASWLDRRERDVEEAPDDAIDLIGVKKGFTVADVGAGSGYMTVKLARRVGANGVVYAIDIQPAMIELVEKRVKSAKLANVRSILSAVDDPKLPPASIDLALMVDVYHELSQPQAMLRHIRESLKPGGRLVLLEYRKEDPSIPIRPEHKMSVAEARTELEAEGFKLARVDDGLPRQHVLIFTAKN
jgi:ubiquinone/menaquinone biosynthesis C-methylase UbiE